MKKILALLVISIALFSFKPTESKSALAVKTSTSTDCITVTLTIQGLYGTVYVSHDCSYNGPQYPMGSQPAHSIYETRTVNGIKYGGTLSLISVTYGPLTVKCEGGVLEVYTPWTATYSGQLCKI